MASQTPSVGTDPTNETFGIKYPVRRARLLLSGIGFLFLLYLFGSLLFLIPAFAFVNAYGSVGWVLTVALLSAVIAYVSYRGYRRTLEGILADAERVTSESSPELAEILEFVRAESEARGMEPPSLHIHPAPIANALAVGRRQSGHVVICDGLLTTLADTDELKAVVAHELAHLDNRDSTTMTLSSGIKSIIVRFWTWVGFSLRKWTYERRGVVLTPTEEQALWHKAQKRSHLVCSPMGFVENSISRHREYIADAEAAEATDSAAMIGALESIASTDHDPDELDIPQTLCIHGESEGFLARLRSDHPPIEKRIRYVRKTHGDAEK